MKATEDKIKSLFTEQYSIFTEQYTNTFNSLNDMEHAFPALAKSDPARSALLFIEFRGDEIIKASRFLDEMAVAVPIVNNADPGYQMIDRLESVIDAMNERICGLGKVATALHDMKLSKLQRAIRETELHATYAACYRIRALTNDCMNMILNDPYPDPE